MFARSFNLQDMCLIAIVKDVDLFICNKTIPQKHIDFLFQAYADEVFSKHKILKESINEDCMLWFLNPHVKKVTLPSTFHSERVIQQLKMISNGISSLNLHKSRVSENELNSIICCLPHVVHLDLSETACSNNTLACIVKSCPELESLNVSCCEKVTDIGMKILCDSKLSLKSLNILYSGAEYSGAALVLNGMPSLECIKCDDLTSLLYEIGKNKQYNLTELVHDDTLGNPVTTIKACARMCPKFKKLHFEYPVTVKVLKACVSFQNLEELKIKSSHSYYASVKVNDVLTPILPISKQLKTLILSCVEISVLMLVENFGKLENLYLKKVSFTPFKKEDIKIPETNLTTLVLKNIDMEVHNDTYEAVALLISLSKNVTKLYLTHIRSLPAEIFDIILESMRNLTLVNFSYTHLKMDSLNRLFGIPSMTAVTANCYEHDEENSDLLAKSASCTLSWRAMYDYEEDENRENHNFADETKYFYDDDSDESDTISDACYSTGSESDDKYLRYAFDDCEGDYDYWFNNDPYDWFGYGPYS